MDRSAPKPDRKGKRERVIARVFYGLVGALIVVGIVLALQGNPFLTAKIPPQITPRFLKAQYIVYAPRPNGLAGIAFSLGKKNLSSKLKVKKESPGFFSAWLLPASCLSNAPTFSGGDVPFYEMKYMPAFFRTDRDAYLISGLIGSLPTNMDLNLDGKIYALKAGELDSSDKASYDTDLNEADRLNQLAGTTSTDWNKLPSLHPGPVTVGPRPFLPADTSQGKPIWFGSLELSSGKYATEWLYASAR